MRFTRRLLLFAVIVVGAASCEACPESMFTLSPDSRLPRWMTPPEGLSRAGVTLTMAYYAGPAGRTAIFKLWDPHGHQLAVVEGTLRGFEPNTSPVDPDADGYPSYEVITANGITEVIEHRHMEPIFYVTDDPAVNQWLGVTP